MLIKHNVTSKVCVFQKNYVPLQKKEEMFKKHRKRSKSLKLTSGEWELLSLLEPFRKGKTVQVTSALTKAERLRLFLKIGSKRRKILTIKY